MHAATADPSDATRAADDDALVRRHHRGLWRFARWLGADPPLADDLVQDAFLRLLRSPPVDRRDAAVGAWLRTTTVNLFRSSGRRARAGIVLVDPELLETVWQQEAGADGGDSYRDALASCLAALPERTRQALGLRYRHGLRDTPLAAAMGLRPAGVRTLLRRALVLLADCIRSKHP